MVDVEHRRLGALEEDVLASLELLVEEERALHDVRADALGHGEVRLADLVHRVGGHLVDLLEDLVGIGERGVELLAEDLLVEHVLDAQAGAVHLVHVGRADAALGRADEVLAELLLVGAVEVLVVGHDDVRVAGDLEGVAGDALALEDVDLGEEDLGVDDAAVADHRVGALVHDAGGDLVKRQLVTVGDDGVSGIGAAGVAADDVEVAGDEVGDLALALVAPLSSHEHCSRHSHPSRKV